MALVEDWLLLGPLPCPFPAFHEEGRKKIDEAKLLAYDAINPAKRLPEAGAAISLPGGNLAKWEKASIDTSGLLIPSGREGPLAAYIASYVEVSRWMKVEFEAYASHPFEMTIDGRSIMKATKSAQPGKPDKKTGTAELVRGKHLIVIKTVYVPGDTATDWSLEVLAGPGTKFDAIPVFSIAPERSMSIGDITDLSRIRDVKLSPDGSLVAVTLREQGPPKGDPDSWIEIRNMKSGELTRTIKGVSGLSGLQWAPKGLKLSYTVREKENGSIFLLDLETGAIEPIVEDIENLGGYDWGPDGSFIVYSITEKPEKDKTGIKRLLSLTDRRRGARNRSYLYITSVPAGYSRRLTAGKHSTYVYDIHPNGTRLLFGRYYEDLSARPYGVSELYLMDLNDQSTELLWKGPWMRNATWSPDGDNILILAGPSSFGEIGKNVPKDVIPNDYDTQAYIFDPETKEVEPLTRDFDPAIDGAFWSKVDGNIYFVAEEKTYGRLYRYRPGKKTFQKIELPFDYLADTDLALDKPLAALSGMGAQHPSRLYSLDLKKGRAKLLHDPAAGEIKSLVMGKMEDWNFKSNEGKNIEGRIYYPPDFDPEKIYPCIVYYYGGTSPTPRTFAGRYPKNLWASMGYVVYVLQPSGATGYGQEFSAFHVNDWGKIVSEEIITGVKKFLEAHEFVDPASVGCIGASYGGFMTQLLVTRTDIFAAAVSHAGISSITSYWGEGYWGYGYNAVAAANSFPWNRPDIYVEQSPLFAANKVTTPLLLLHGAVDTNVPPGESEQMYIALKLLGKKVEYIKYAEQNHFILDYKKRIAWSNAIVAWFDRWLKDEPEWWNNLYPPVDGEEPEEPGEVGMHRVELEKYGTVLLGEISRGDIIENLQDWDAEFFEYTPDATLTGELEDPIYSVDFVIVLGTWCSDSRREIPRLWKILEELQYPIDEIKMFGVGSSRFTKEMPIPEGVLEWSDKTKAYYGVERVATVIVYREGREIGRIIESPEESLEQDLVRIIGK
jgi:dipeptidyl aminopeptidase/acylaminoacyl peptidase